MNSFTILFHKILAKYSPNAPNCTIFKKIIQGSIANAWLCHALHAASRHANTPTFSKIF